MWQAAVPTGKIIDSTLLDVGALHLFVPGIIYVVAILLFPKTLIIL
jgi:UPF0716 family protein affecting phage T7 exclusion